MNKYNFAISIIVTLMILDFFIMGYCFGLLDYFNINILTKNTPATSAVTANTTAGTSTQQPPPTQPESQQKPQEQQTEQTIPEGNQQKQRTEQPEENNDKNGYSRDEINNMIADNYLANVCSEAELPELADINSSFQDKTINGETCYISMVGGAEDPRSEFFWVGSESLNVYTSDNRVIGKITDNFVSSYDDFMALIDNVQTTDVKQKSTITPDEAMKLIEEKIMPQNNYNGTSLSYLYSGDETIDSKECYLFGFGDDTPEKFTATKHFAVSIDGNYIYEMDLSTAEYKIIWSK